MVHVLLFGNKETKLKIHYILGLGLNSAGPSVYALMDSSPNSNSAFFGVGIKQITYPNQIPGPNGIYVRHMELHVNTFVPGRQLLILQYYRTLYFSLKQ